MTYFLCRISLVSSCPTRDRENPIRISLSASLVFYLSQPREAGNVELELEVWSNKEESSCKYKRQRKGRGFVMAQKELLDKMSIYVPQGKIDKQPVERLIMLGKRRDRSVNYLVVEAILQYLDHEEKRG